METHSPQVRQGLHDRRVNKPHVILLVGPPASGKTTWSLVYRMQHENTIIVGRDKLREMLFGYTEGNVQYHFKDEGFKERENTVTTYQHLLIREALAAGNTVIVDDTNLDSDRIKKFIRDYDRYAVRIVPVHASREDCLTRNAERTRQVDDETINKLYDRYEAMLAKGLPESTHAPIIIPYVPNPFAPMAYIVDLDGTLADHSHRKTFGCTDAEILADAPIEPVVNLVRLLKAQGFSIQFLSGRESVYYKATWLWLERHFNDLSNCDLHMRSTKDFRKDSIIKQELFWKHIAPNYNVVAAVDDRKQVKQMWYDLGVFVFDVNQTDSWF